MPGAEPISAVTGADGAAALRCAVILAAGLGRRLGGRAKAALQLDGLSLLERLVHALHGAGLQSVGVVIGPYAEQLLPLVQRCGARPLRCPQVVGQLPPQGWPLAASQRLAVAQHLQHTPAQGLMLLLADLPLLTQPDITLLQQAWVRRDASVQALRPVVAGVHGHPLLLAPSALRAIAAQPATLGIRDWLQQLPPQALQALPSDRPGYVTDLDTPADLQALRRRLWPRPLCWPPANAADAPTPQGPGPG